MGSGGFHDAGTLDEKDYGRLQRFALGKRRADDTLIAREKIEYCVKSSRRDWRVARHLFEKGDYPYALFFGIFRLKNFLKPFL